MAQDPLHVLWIEPQFPGRLGAVADWLVRRRGYRSWFYHHTVEPHAPWPPSAGHGLEVQHFGVGGVAREPAVAWTRALERSLCYSYGCWEVLESRKPRPLDLIVGRSDGLGSTLFAPVYAPAAPVVSLFDYYIQPRRNDLVEDDAGDASDTYFHWRRSANASELLELEQTDLAWTTSRWQQSLYPAEYRDDFWVQHDGIVIVPRAAGHRPGRRVIGERTLPEGTRVVSFIARSLDRLRGFDRFWQLANALLRDRADVVCVIAGNPIVQRGLDVHDHQQDFPARLAAASPAVDPERIWFLGRASPAVVSDVLAATDLHIAPGRPYPVSRSLLEAMGAGCVVLASDTEPHREVIRHGETGLLSEMEDPADLFRQATAVLNDPSSYDPIRGAAREHATAQFDREVCLPRLAERFSALAESRRR